MLEQQAYRELTEPREIKAFADPLRMRIVHVLLARAATNQQVAGTLGEPAAKVFHHMGVLLDAGLIRLVETRVTGGNVEKFYRAVARSFILRPGGDLLPQTGLGVLAAGLERVRSEVLASAAHWPDAPPRVLLRKAYLTPQRLAAFQARLDGLIAEFWGDAGEVGLEGVAGAVLSVLTYWEASAGRDRGAGVDKDTPARRASSGGADKETPGG